MISVCLASYNGERYIERQVTSILSQLEKDDELIVSDDGSTDATLDILAKLNDSRISIVDGAHRHSPIWNFENALKKARGEFIFLSDQDDEWMPDKVKVSLQYLKDYDCVVSDNKVVTPEGKIISDSFYAVNKTKPGRYYNLFIKNGYLGCCMAFRRNVMEASLPFPQDIPMHDIWIGNVAAFKYSVCFIPGKLMNYNRHGDNASSASSPSVYSLAEKLRFRWVIMHNLCKLKLRK